MATNVTSLAFNGSNRYAKLSTNASIKNMSDFTWMAWVMVGPLSVSSQQRMWTERQGSGNGVRFAAIPYKGRLRFELCVQDTKTDTNYDYKYDWDDRWHHIAFVGRINGATPTYEIYLDGTKRASGTLIKPSGVNNVSNTTPLGSIYVGNHSLATVETFLADRYWDGYLDEVLIFNTAKSGADILAYYSSKDTWSMSDAEMFSYWRFDENTGTSTTDSDNGGWTGTLYQGGVASSALWHINRPFLGNGASDTTAPTAPTLGGTPTTNVSADGFTASWNATTDNIYVQGYEVHLATVSNYASYIAYDMKTVLTKTFTGLLPATNYYWRVRAYDAAMNYSTTATSQAVTTSGSGDVTPPLAPTALNATSVTASGFTLNYTQSASSDETGYKVDIGLDPNFNTYLTNYRNKDVGNVVTTSIVGTSPLTTYYCRVRAYDAAENESDQSAVLAVQTPTAPDVIAPLDLVLAPATSITSRGFTANWEEGFDNVGISYYVLDVSLVSDFSTYLSNSYGSWQNKNVGLVTSYRVDDLSPNTTYYFRARAYDAAGNVSGNVTPFSVVTAPPSIDEGGVLTTLVQCYADAWNDSGSTGTNHGTDTSLYVLGNGASNTKSTYLQFDLTGVVGTIASAALNLYVTEASAASIAVFADGVTFDEATINWSNQPTVSGSSININPSTINSWVTVDIASLLLDGKTTYAVKITGTSADGVTFASRESANAPYIELDHDPSTATDVQDIITTDLDGVLVNYVPNPSFETDTTNWSISNSGTTISRVTSEYYSGIASLQLVTDGSVSGQGAYITPTTSTIPTTLGTTWTLTFWAKCSTGTQTLNGRIYCYTSGGALNESSPVVAHNISTTWRRFSVTYTPTLGTTTAVSVIIYLSGLTAATFFIDAVSMTKGTTQGVFFDGNTSGAYWTGTANKSVSKINTGKLTFDSTYIGDADGDNSVALYVKRAYDLQWMAIPTFQSTVSINRTTKRTTSTVGSSYGPYNLINNPSFEVNTTGWSTLVGAGSVAIAQDTDNFEVGIASLKVTVSATTGIGILSNTTPSAAALGYGASVWVKGPIGLSLKLLIQALDSGGSVLGSSTVTYGSSATIADGTWTYLKTTYTTPASTASVRLAVLTDDADGGIFYVDAALLNNGLWVNPYRDGTYDDAQWEGTAHNSVTSLFILPQTEYDIMHTYTDPDGTVDNFGGTTASVAERYTTAAVPDNVTTGGTLTLVPTVNSIEATATYLGDDNSNMTAVLEYRRTDLTNWTAVPCTITRAAKSVTGVIANLNAGSSYTVRVTFSDVDGLYNNPLTAVTATTTALGAAAGVSRVTFGGFVLFDESLTDWPFGVVSHDAFGLPDRRLQIEDLPLVDGAVQIQDNWGRRTIKMSGFISGDTQAELEDNKNALKKALSPGLRPLIIDTLGNYGRYYTATCTNFDAPHVGGQNFNHLTWDAVFVCPDPFAYDTQTSVMPETTVVNGGQITVNNLGDLKTDLLMKIRTTHNRSTTVTIANTTTGERITPQSTILNGDRLIIDSSQYDVLKNGIRTNYAGGFIRLNPGGNTFTFTVSATSGTPTLYVEFRWNTKYI